MIKTGEVPIEKAAAEKNIELGNCLVIGGAGMLGFSIAQQLLESGHSVTICDIEEPAETAADYVKGDIRDRECMFELCKNADTVFQCAAAVWDPHTEKRVYDDVNVTGNLNVIDACLNSNVPRLIYTSTMDVVVDGIRPIEYGDESLPYPEKMPEDHYSRTKIIAEQHMLKADCEKLSVCVLRPAGIYGPGDKYHLPNIAALAENRFSVKLGNGSACFSHVYCENAAYAHILAAKKLYYQSAVSGQVYFIVDHQPAQNLFTFMEPFLLELGLKPPVIKIPYSAAYMLAWIAEKINPRSVFNRFSVIQTCIDHTFVSDKAQRDFGYAPKVSLDESIRRTVEWFKKNSTS